MSRYKIILAMDLFNYDVQSSIQKIVLVLVNMMLYGPNIKNRAKLASWGIITKMSCDYKCIQK